MAIYNPESLSAEEFINHDEILETLQYAKANKNNIELIDSILEKARPKHYADGRIMHCPGLTHREASVLLACDIPEKIEEIYKLANEIKLSFYGNRIVMFAPLYLSNYCVNGCVYCPYHLKNKSIARKKLTQQEIRDEVIALQDMGHKRLAIEAGEDPVHNPIEYILESMVEQNNDYLDDERCNLNIQLSRPILLIADIGRWDGRYPGYAEIKSGNIRDCLYSEMDDSTWYVDRLGDLRCDAVHHDGTNHYLYRAYKENASEAQIDRLKEKLYSGTATRSDVTRVTKRLGDEIGRVYGWRFPSSREAMRER